MIATTQVDRTTPITTSTTATIGFQGLTGIGFIGLTGGNVNDRNILQSAIEQGTTPVIRANPSDVTDILATARDIADRANNILGEFESIVQAVGPSVRTTAENVAQTSTNVRTFTDSLAANANQIDDFLGSLARLSTSANNVAERLPPLIDSVGNFVSALNVGAVNDSIQNIAAITQSVRGQTDNFVTALDSIGETARSLGSVGEVIRQNTPSLNAFLGRLDPISATADRVATKLDTTLGDVNRLTAAVNADEVRSVVDNVSGFAAALNGQSSRIGTVVAATDTVLATLNNALTGVNGTRARVDNLSQGSAPTTFRAPSTMSRRLRRTSPARPTRSALWRTTSGTDARTSTPSSAMPVTRAPI